MKVQVLNGIGDVRTLPASRVLVSADDGTPLAVVVERSAGVVSVAHAGDRDFAGVLAMLGVDRTVIVDTVTPRPAIEILEAK